MSAAATKLYPPGFDIEPSLSRAAWLDRRRADALKHFHAAGIPHRRVEEWKYSDLRSALESPRESKKAGTLAPNPFKAIACTELCIANGRLVGNDQEPRAPGVEIIDLSAGGADAPDWAKTNLGQVLKGSSIGEASLALMTGGVALRISREVTTPLHLRFEQQADVVHARVLVVLDEGASLLLLESHAQAAGLADIGVEFVLAPQARLTHMRLADTAPDAIHVQKIGVRIERSAKYRAHFSQNGAKLTRADVTVALEQAGAEAELTGSAMLHARRHSDITTHVLHNAGKTASRQLFKYAAADHARAVYQGKITVARGADGSDSRQTAKAILLGDRAEADLKPELEILADDVKCAHGAAVGDLDTDSLFYLRARGIPEADARRLLLQAFLEETISDMDRNEVRAAVWRFVERDLGGAEIQQ